MSFVAQFSVSQSADSSSLTIVDTSNYTSEPKSTFTSRVLYLYKVDGTAVRFPSTSTTDGINFPFSGGDSITITGFTQDFCLRIEMVLTSSNPQSGSIYTATNVITMIGYTSNALLNAAQLLATNPIRLTDSIFTDSLVQLQREKVTATIAGSYADQFSSQAALDRANQIILQQNIRF
jgi:hypothetical protein